ncbi:hypothetical protein CH330_02340 [candidate division WOR-3 bacterium JGI_Cruoil_03_51_56]|uniref:ABC transporter domain-containing protein n=1 Tax=candidate division WOR-3 bacterium JGI_Cruoil_03_51_56 TaxID=1973747 RepID=A0A235BWA7_UNCW3|nr:MAG: hypothetical protein CH330_02340 [candidate division WOR-3 bacterium JGI_Cruoil_03_51_56]
MIRVKQVSKRFRDRLVLDKVNLEVPDSKVIVILGPSGIGKTVMLHVMAGLLRPDHGSVSYDGLPLRFGAFADNRPILVQLGYVFQNGALFDSMDVAENVALPLKENSRLEDSEMKKRVKRTLERVGMAGHEALSPHALSGGMIKLVAIARALVSGPHYVFYDEPTSGLDPLMRERICNLIKSLRDREGKTGVVVTHDLEAAEAVANKIYMLKDGRLSTMGQARKEDYEETHS